MKAVYIERHGEAAMLQYGDLPEPVPGPGELKVRVRAAAVNRLDLYTRLGIRGSQVPPERFPHILGGDCAGEVAELGDGVSGLEAGQRVVVDPLVSCGTCDYCRNDQPSHCAERRMVGTHLPGSYAQYVVVPANNALPLADNLTYEQAAGMPTVYLPTWAIIVREGRLQRGETALVLSGSSGVGTAAIQIAKHVADAKCIASTSSDAKAGALRELGADDVVNYKTEDVARRVMELTGGRGVDLVVDSVGTSAFEAAFSVLAKGGRYGLCGVTSGYKADLHLGQLFTKGIHLFGVFMGPLGDLRKILEQASGGSIRSAVGATFPLEEAQQAHELMESGEHVGKIMLLAG